jgi:acylphosphatase
MNIHMVISGRVQGVGFRAGARKKAVEYDLTGWVRNNTDGTVELEAEGSEDRLNAYIDTLKAGFNPFVQVEHIKKQKNMEEKGYRQFRIK